MAEHWIPIGTVNAVNPARREIRIKPEPARKDQFNQVQWLRVTLREGAGLRCRVNQTRAAGGYVIVALNPGVPRDTIAQMKGAFVEAGLDEKRSAEAGALAVEELEGLAVVDGTGAVLGTVAAIYTAGGNDVLEVEAADGSRFRFPAIPEAIEDVDLDRGRLTVGDLTPFRVDDAD